MWQKTKLKKELVLNFIIKMQNSDEEEDKIFEDF
jgi:hypothetical protein